MDSHWIRRFLVIWARSDMWGIFLCVCVPSWCGRLTSHDQGTHAIACVPCAVRALCRALCRAVRHPLRRGWIFSLIYPIEPSEPGRAMRGWMAWGVCVWMFGHVESSNARDRDRRPRPRPRPRPTTTTGCDCTARRATKTRTLDFGLWTLDDGW